MVTAESASSAHRAEGTKQNKARLFQMIQTNTARKKKLRGYPPVKEMNGKAVNNKHIIVSPFQHLT